MVIFTKQSSLKNLFVDQKRDNNEDRKTSMKNRSRSMDMLCSIVDDSNAHRRSRYSRNRSMDLVSPISPPPPPLTEDADSPATSRRKKLSKQMKNFAKQSSFKNLFNNTNNEDNEKESNEKDNIPPPPPPPSDNSPPTSPGLMKKYYDHVTQDSLSALHYFCRSGNCSNNKSILRDMKAMIDRHPEVVSQRTPVGGDTPLHYAVAMDDLDTVRLLLKVNPSTVLIKSNENGYFGNQKTALHVAIATQSSLEMIDILIQASPKSVKVRDGRGRSVQDLALKYYSDDGYTLSILMEKFLVKL